MPKEKLPKGWTECLLGDIAQLIGGGTSSSSDSSNFSNMEGHPRITPADLGGYKESISSGARGI